VRWVVGIVLVACSAPAPSPAPPPPPAPASALPPAPAPASAPAPAPAQPLAIGPLVPWEKPEEWKGAGIPPKQLSLYDVPASSPLPGYAKLDRDACEAELTKRSIAFTRGEDTPGVRAPVRITAPLHGVAIHSPFPPAARAHSKADLIDCRLALSLDDFATRLAAHDIVEAIHISAYRSNKEGGCTAKYPGEQHCAALAVDVASFKKKDGKELVVERDFHGKIGSLTCATNPPPNELWQIACEAAQNDFLVVLTPNWNQEHHNHFHLELTTHDWVLAR
jgi:hypothetical protein